MAANKEQREIEIVLNGQKVNASLKEMGAAASLMNNQLKKMASDDPGREKLKKDFHDMRGRIGSMRDELYNVEKASLAAKLGLNDMSGIMKTAMGTAGGFLLGGGIQGVLTGVIGGFSAASDAAKDFEKSLSSLKSLTGASAEDLKYYEEQAALIGQTTTLSASQAVDAFKLIGSAKPELLKNKEALAEVTYEAVALAEAAEIELPEAAQALAGALNQFNLPASESSRIINSLAAGSKEGAANIPEIQASIDKFGTSAAAFNVNFEESVALVEVLAEKNMKGAESGTALRNVLSKMASAKALPASALEELEKFGVNIEVISDKSIPMNERLREFSKISGDATALTKVFGAENQIAGGIILNNVDKFEQLTEAVTGTNTAYEQQAINTDNLEGDTAALNSVMESYAITIGSGLNVAKRAGIQLMTKFLLILKEAPAFIKENKTLFYALGAAIIALNLGNIKAAASAIAHTAAEKARAIATKTTTTYQWLLNAAMTANPIGLVVAAIALLVGGFVTLYNNSEKVRAGVNALWEGLKTLASNAGALLKALVTMDFAELSRIGRETAASFKKGYNDKLEEDKQKQQKKEKAEHQQALQEAEVKGEQLGKAQNKGDEKAKKERLRQEKKHQEELKRAREEYNQAVAKTELENAKLRIELMDQGVDKVLAKLRLQHEQELKEIEAHRQKVVANAAITEDERNILLDQYAEQRRMKEEGLRLAEEEAKASQREKDKEEFYTQLAEEEEYQALALEEQFLRAFDAEYAREQALLELRRQTLEQKLHYLREAGLSETAEALRIGNELVKIERDVAQNKIEQAEKIAKAKKGFEDIIMNGAIDTFRTTVDLLDKEKHARGIAMAAFKTFSLGKIAVDAQEEIQAIWKTANQNPINALIPGAGTAIAVVKTAAALTRATAAAKAVHAQAFAGGGMTRGGKTIPMVEVGGLWEMASGMSGGSIGAFANGGWVNDAQLGLIGERGRELVIPNWMVESPKYANLIGYLEAERQKGVRAFADGGMTTGNTPAPQAPDQDDRLVQKFDELLDEFREMKEEVSTWQRELQVHNNVGETREKLQVLNDLERRAFG